ncbi:MAG: ADP-forming succinate--CoA ligase subunit beta [Candidatus Omnitrophica bacterium]|nr:ADP-forming succinate--CoA ligase subunit beta [Candidatus Omnitrophota bacterium]
MNLHEYQAKQLLAQYGAVIPFGCVAVSVEEAEAAAAKIHGPWVIKAQIHAGGRGKAGGIQIANQPQELKSKTGELLGKELATRQSGGQGRVVHKVLVEEKISFQKECYLALTTDREKAVVSILASRHGGMEIEEMAQKHPEDIWVEPIDPLTGVRSFHIRRVAKALGVNGKEAVSVGTLLKQLYGLYTELELSILEINPLVFGEGIRSKEPEWIVLDAKISADDNALFRHQNLEALRDLNEEDPAETEANRHGLSYVRLNGDIGCMVNGAGLAMATLDEIKNHGLEPANFLDIGGGANSERVAKAIEIITSDARVQVILINIFGGITQCDQVAQGVIDALKGRKRLLPMVVRLEGTRVEEGRKLFQSTSLPITPAGNLSEAAKEIKKHLKHVHSYQQKN